MLKSHFARWLTFPAAIAFLLFYLVFVISITGRIIEPDIWWHLRNAQHFVQTHHVVRFDAYSYTVAGARWIDHEWLSELIYYAAFRSLGLRGLFLLFVAVAAAIFMALYYRCQQAEANPKNASILLSIGILMATVSFGPRPLLFGWLCLMALLIILDRFSTTRSAPLWAIPLLFGLWINLHGSWLIGIIVFFLFIASACIEGEWGIISSERLKIEEIKKLLLIAGVSVAALFVNPFGYRLVAYPFDLLIRQGANISNIDEWQSVDFHSDRGKLVMLTLLILFAATLLSRRRWKLYEALTAGLALYVSLMYWRMQFFAALVFVPILATRLPLFPPYDPEKEKPILNGIIMAGVVIMLLVRMPSEAQLNEQIWRQYPTNALAVVRNRGMGTRVFNDFAWGGYIIWNAPEVKTFIDGRTDIFVYAGVLDDYLKVMRVQDSTSLLDHYGVQTILLRPDAVLVQYLDRDPCWREVYNDKLAVVLHREPSTPGCASRTMAGK